jgi:ectoine hydroxylase-related dioxygenase (phytanoyl-CoA dioxygenase family)
MAIRFPPLTSLISILPTLPTISNENQFLAYPKEIVRCFPERLKHLLGYQMHRPNLGGWEGQDPIRWLDDSGEPHAHADALTPEIAAQLREHYAVTSG